MFTKEEWIILQDVISEAISWEKLEHTEDSKEQIEKLKEIKKKIDKNVEY